MTTEGQPFTFDAVGEAIRFAPATLRNRDAILDILQDVLPHTGTIFELASGTGEHVVYFAKACPQLTWQPSDYDPAALISIAAWMQEAVLPNVLAPVRIDTSASDWPVVAADAIICINMVHIAPWAAVEGMFAGARQVLHPGAPLYLYGPYAEADKPLADSNAQFDRSLRSRNPEWGLRVVEDIEALATAYGFALDQRIAMPANNLSLVFRRQSQ